MSSVPGRAMTRDVLACTAAAAPQCGSYTRQQIEAIAARGRARGEPALDVDAVMDLVVAPVMYRILFDTAPLDTAWWRGLLARVVPPAG
jgi:hypothetical protein